MTNECIKHTNELVPHFTYYTRATDRNSNTLNFNELGRISTYVRESPLLANTTILAFDQSLFHSRMASLDDEIADLKAEIEGYKNDLKEATSPIEKSELRGLIKSCRDNLTELEKRKNAQSNGEQ